MRHQSTTFLIAEKPAREAYYETLDQLASALATLHRAANETDATNSATAWNWIQPSVRQAEKALHDLRGLGLTKTNLLTELTQSLTVLVLAADMLANGHLQGDLALESQGLMQRNAERSLIAFKEIQQHDRI
jgi:ABC-type transporter Mla subunit MlaD